MARDTLAEILKSVLQRICCMQRYHRGYSFRICACRLLVAPCNERYLPAGQSAHASGPLMFLYVPVAHSWQPSAAIPVNPASHKQCAITVLCTVKV